MADTDRCTVDVVTDIRERVEDLSAAVALWAMRDDTKAQPTVRRAANDAVSAIDAAVRDLHLARARLLGEIRHSDDATATRVDALLVGRNVGRVTS
jgi:hypothetical protein